MSKKKKSTDEVKQVAKEIASVVVATNAEKPKVDVPKAEPVVVKAETKVEKPKVVEAKSAPVKNIKIKATASVKGQYTNMRYEIKAGEVYTFPAPLAEWLISLGRAI
jgi:hypothetical protein